MTHVPVMTAEVLQQLRPERGGVFVDCTVGLGGHSRALLEAGASRVIGLDRDRDALARARETLAPWADRVELVHADYRALDEVLDAVSFARRRRARGSRRLVDAVRRAGPRLQLSTRRTARYADGSHRGDTAADLVARASERELAEAIFQFGEERFSRRIARAIVEARREAPIATTGALATIVRRAIPRARPHAHRSGDTDVSGAAHLGQPRARGARPRSSKRRRAGFAPAGGWSSSRFTRSRIGS